MKIVIDIDEEDYKLITEHYSYELSHEFTDEIFMRIENGTSLEKELDKWISVKDRLPSKSRKYLVTYGSNLNKLIQWFNKKSCEGCETESEEQMIDTLTEYMQKKYDERTDKDNIFGVGISDAEFRTFIIDYLLDDWYTISPLGQTQINELALYEILMKYSKRYKRELNGRKRGNKK